MQTFKRFLLEALKKSETADEYIARKFRVRWDHETKKYIEVQPSELNKTK